MSRNLRGASVSRITNASRVLLFWLAFVLTRPLEVMLGYLLDKPLAENGQAISRFYAWAFLVILIVALAAFGRITECRQ